MFNCHRAPTAVAWALLILSTASHNSFADTQEILGRHYSQEPGRLFITDQNGEKWDIAPDMILMRFTPNASAADVAQVLDSNELWPTARLTKNAAGYRQFNYATDRDPLAVLIAVAVEPWVEDACLDTQVKFFGDPYYANQWNLQKMRMEKAWEVTRGDPAITIAIIDDGIDYAHEDLVAQRWLNPNDAVGDGVDNDNDSSWYGSPMVDDFTGWDFRSNDRHPLPDTMCIGNPVVCSADHGRHGTAVAGLAMATCDNSLGIAGTCGARGGDGPKFMTIRLRSQAASTVADAIEYAWRKGATVVNMSFGIYSGSVTAVAAQLDSAAAHGVILVAAAGNDGSYAYPFSHVKFPALYPSVIGVGATDQNDVRWGYSCMGPELDVVAPSGRIGFTDLWTTDNDPPLPGDYNPDPVQCPTGCPPGDSKYFSKFNGTSGASPEVASIAALLKSRMPGLTPTQVRQRLIDSAVDLGDVGPDSLYGYGRVDAYRTLTEWGTITGDVVWYPEDTADSTRYVSGDLTIAPGDTLTIMPGTRVRIANDDDLGTGADTDRIEINVQGTLIADGTAANPIIFESWASATTADWAGIYFDDESGGGTFDHCKISRAEYAIESWAPVSITNTEIDSCLYVGVLSRGGGGLVRGCSVTNPGYIGIAVESDSLSVRSTAISGALAYGIEASVTGSVGVDSACTFNDNEFGAFFYTSGRRPTLKRSTINSNTSVGVFCTGGSTALIHDNTIRYNGAGIDCSFSSPTITENIITSNGTGVWVSGYGDPDIGHYPGTGGNTIALSTGYDVVNFYTETWIYAQNNCWGKTSAPCGPSHGKISGYVDFSSAYCCSADESMVAQHPGSAGPMRKTSLGAVVPNPFNPATTIHYDLGRSGMIEMRVYEVTGRLVRELVRGTNVAGSHQVRWDGTDRQGGAVASGIYFVRMVADGQTFTRKLVLLK